MIDFITEWDVIWNLNAFDEIMILVRFLLPGRKEHSEYPWTTSFLPLSPSLPSKKKHPNKPSYHWDIWKRIHYFNKLLFYYLNGHWSFSSSSNVAVLWFFSIYKFLFPFLYFFVCFIDVVRNWIQFIVIEFTFIFLSFIYIFFPGVLK